MNLGEFFTQKNQIKIETFKKAINGTATLRFYDISRTNINK